METTAPAFSMDFLDSPAFGPASSLSDLEVLNLQPGDVFDNFTIIRRLGAGGMGVLYAARRKGDNCEVALKLLRRGADARMRDLLRFEQEAGALSRLSHPAIARLESTGRSPGGIPFIAMELVHGQSLAKHLATPRTLAEKLALFLQVCDAVGYAHRCGIVHRDLKPENIYVTDAGAAPGTVPKIKILDFGLARPAEERTLTTTLSRTGEIFGTLAYMSPEQARGDVNDIGPASDIYSLGVILYEMVCGRVPFRLEGRPLHEILHSICKESPRRPAGAPFALRPVLRTALQKDPRHRYSSAAALHDDVRRYMQNAPVVAGPARPLAATWQMIRRHPSAAASIAAMALALAVGADFYAAAVGRANVAEGRLRERRTASVESIRLMQDSSLFVPGVSVVALSLPTDPLMPPGSDPMLIGTNMGGDFVGSRFIVHTDEVRSDVALGAAVLRSEIEVGPDAFSTGDGSVEPRHPAEGATRIETFISRTPAGAVNRRTAAR